MIRDEHFDGDPDEPEPEIKPERETCSFGFDDHSRFNFHADLDTDDGMIVDAAMNEARDSLFAAGKTDVTWSDTFVEMARRSLAGAPLESDQLVSAASPVAPQGLTEDRRQRRYSWKNDLRGRPRQSARRASEPGLAERPATRTGGEVRAPHRRTSTTEMDRLVPPQRAETKKRTIRPAPTPRREPILADRPIRRCSAESDPLAVLCRLPTDR